jgi:hypothetical protein
METSLHRQLKMHYAQECMGAQRPGDARIEVRLGRYRIDVVRDEELIEIQHGSLAAIRGKIKTLLVKHRVRVVKPIVCRKHLVKRRAAGRRVIDRRLSPKRGSIYDLFHDMVYFCRVFPHQNLVLEVPLVEIEEWRYPGHGRRRWRRASDHQVEDQKLLGVQQVHQFRTPSDLLALLPTELPSRFSTEQLAEVLDVHRSFARAVAYSLRETGAIRRVAKQGNAWLYEGTSAK